MPDPATACAVTYVEARTAMHDDARRILVDHVAAQTGAPGPATIDLLQRTGTPGQFVLVETGAPAAAGVDTAIAALAPMLLAPCDVRSHAALSVAPVANTVARHDALWVVTHVDIVPAHKDDGVAQVRRLAEASRGERGCLRFEAWQQTDRPNHMTLVEAWTDAAARDAHRESPHARGFRDRLAPIGGALYDERVYSRLAP